MATTYAVDLVFKSQGLGKLDTATKKLQGIDGAASKAANSIKPIGGAAKGAATGVRGLGVAFKAALGPIGAALAAIGGLTAAFETLKTQDFAAAKFKTLGGNAAELNEELKKVSAELKGQASVVELTGAAYDVASAGFSKAADAAQVLKAASLGAVGGFSDINTVGNAATSVLNAYGLAASEAGAIVDQFIQTQNDGKIVVAEYASNIGKVASAAAGLGIPLAEVNAIIAQSTAAGVQAEVAFTGIKSALARLASGEANKALADLGVEVTSASLASEGLIGTLKRIDASGADVGQVFKALGTEAAPALLPVLNNLEKTDQLLANQRNSAGAAAEAQATAADTIAGAWKAVQTEVQNLFSDQSELGEAIKITLQATALALKGVAIALNAIMKPAKETYKFIKGVGDAIEQEFAIFENLEKTAKAVENLNKVFQKLVSDIGNILSGLGQELAVAFSKPLNDIADAWDGLMKGIGDLSKHTVDVLSQQWEFYKGVATSVMDFVGQAWNGLMTNAAGEASAFGEFVNSVWNGISSGVQSVVSAITNAFATAFSAVSQMVADFYNSLPSWMRGALEGVVAAGGAIGGAVGNAFNAAGSAISDAFSGGGGGAAATAPTYSPQTFSGTSGGGGAAGGGGGGKGGGGASNAERLAQLEAKRLEDAQEMLAVAQAELGIKEALTPIAEAQLQSAENIRKINAEYAGLIKEATSEETKRVLEQAKGVELQLEGVKLEKELADLREAAVGGIRDEIEMLQARLNGTEDVLRAEREIARLRAGGVDGGTAASLVETRDQLKKQTEAQDKAKDSAEQLAGSIASSLTGSLRGLIDGSMSAEEALSNAFQGIADAFIDMAMQMIQEWLKMQMMNILNSAGGGLFGGGFSPFSEGGYVSGPTPALVGEGSEPEYIIPESKMEGAMSRYSGGARGSSVVNGAEAEGGGGEGPMAEAPTSISISGGVMQFGGDDYIRKDQLPSIISQAGQQGEKRALLRLRNSPSSRRRIGL